MEEKTTHKMNTNAKLLNNLYGKHGNNDNNTPNITTKAVEVNYYRFDKVGFIYADTDSIHCTKRKEG